MGRRSPSPQRAVFVSVGNCVPHDTKASGEMHIPRRGRWLPAQLHSGASVRCGVYFFAHRKITAGAAWPRRNCLERARQSVQSHSPSPSHLYAYSVHSASSSQTAVSRFPCAARATFPFFRAGPRRRKQEGFQFFSAFSRHFQERIKTHKICCSAFSHPFPFLF